MLDINFLIMSVNRDVKFLTTCLQAIRYTKLNAGISFVAGGDEKECETYLKLALEHKCTYFKPHNIRGLHKKSACLNTAFRNADPATMVSIFDCDFVISDGAAKLMMSQLGQNCIFSYPQFRLTDEQAEFDLNTEYKWLKFCSKMAAVAKHHNYGTCATPYYLTSETYRQVRGSNESFKGWGYEDLAFYYTVKSHGIPGINISKEGFVYHLPHYGNRVAVNFNHLLYHSLRAKIDKDGKIYSNANDDWGKEPGELIVKNGEKL